MSDDSLEGLAKKLADAVPQKLEALEQRLTEFEQKMK